MNYNRLWKLLIHRELKIDLQAMSGVNFGIITKLGENEDVNTSILVKTCEILECNIGDIMDVISIIPESNGEI